jgi:hypothetical protein
MIAVDARRGEQDLTRAISAAIVELDATSMTTAV